MSNTNAIITILGKQKLVKARAGDTTLATITGMAFGDGGVDGEGNVLTPLASQSALNNELLRKQITSHTFIADTTERYVCTLTSAELAGKMISEIGLYDSAGDLVCIKNFLPKGKDSGIEQTYTIDDIF